MKVATVALVLGVLAALFVGRASSAGDQSPRIHLTARQNELARTTSLRRGDLPSQFRGGFVAGRPTGLSCRSFSPRVDDLTATGFANAAFSNGHGDAVSSAVTVMADKAQVARDMNRSIRPPLARCLGTMLASANGATLVSAVRVPLRTDLEHGAKYRIVLRRDGRLQTLSYYVFGHGRLECRLTVRGTGHSIPPHIEHLVVSLIETRMED